MSYERIAHDARSSPGTNNLRTKTLQKPGCPERFFAAGSPDVAAIDIPAIDIPAIDIEDQPAKHRLNDRQSRVVALQRTPTNLPPGLLSQQADGLGHLRGASHLATGVHCRDVRPL